MNHRFDGPEVGLFLNGEIPPFLEEKFSFYKKIFAVDGAFYYLNTFGVSVDYIIGDFDSLLKKDILNIPLKTRILKTYDQRYTDFDKALNIVYDKGFLNINVWGANGVEQDHFLGNLSTALKYKDKLSIIFHDKYHSYFFSDKKTYFYQKKNKKVSLFPFPKVEGLYTYGLRYSIKKGLLKIGKNIGIRNEAYNYNQKIEIHYKNGELLIFIER
ncbi:Thiamine Pyrophosphokinase [Blattabacterium sp. (Nauphoeta cinerea)]|uniref:thiamine diphosphokinase n=1 Tax=Blattabacterium sp. (Nauphoeta cinerea) TaxID=1316444 RepID=UPI0003B0AC0D|nr:thiamine diphosphokinase [Blattabacterium sp. (Nauphoeta cinerea)]AGW86359.1 Thiamine Pyrophosphokinase [Blattabacterium sp. (Nauphoeta cinerea)]